MPESFSLKSLTSDIKLALMNASDKFDSADEGEEAAGYRHLVKTAVSDMCRVRPNSVHTTITLAADVDSYVAPADAIAFKYSSWGRKQRDGRKIWESDYPRRLPFVTLERTDPPTLIFSHPPSSSDISQLGDDFSYWYLASHSWLDDGTTSIAEVDRDLLIHRAATESMKILAIDRVNRLTQVKGYIGGSRNGEPAALYKVMMEEFLAAA